MLGSSFDELADNYDRYRTGYSDEVYDALAEYEIGAKTRVLDLGCGTGLVSEQLAARGCEVVGVDISTPMLERARVRVPQATFVVAPAEELPFESGRFDAVTSAQAFHWFDQPRTLRELARVTRPGGTIAVWWKGLMRGDNVRHVREETALELGLDPPKDLLAMGFAAFGESTLDDKRLRVIPWLVTVRVSDYLGYERSRARARAAYGDRLDAYFALLTERLGPADSVLELNYLHYLYLGRVPGEAAA